jgi:histidinol phosphatase-like enzyme
VSSSLREPCPCKKPSTLLYERAAHEHGIDAAASFVIGDSPGDARTARHLGARGCLVRNGWAVDPRVVEEGVADAAILPSFRMAVDWIFAGQLPRST